MRVTAASSNAAAIYAAFAFNRTLRTRAVWPAVFEALQRLPEAEAPG